jgi:hypothetical protein
MYISCHIFPSFFNRKVCEIDGGSIRQTAPTALSNLEQGCQIFLGTIYQNGGGGTIPNNQKIYRMATKYTKWPQNIPNARKITKWTYYLPTSSIAIPWKNLPKLGFLVWKYAVWQPWFGIGSWKIMQNLGRDRLRSNCTLWQRNRDPKVINSISILIFWWPLQISVNPWKKNETRNHFSEGSIL